MKKRINEISSVRYVQRAKSDLYTRYRFAFERLLPLDVSINGSEEDDKLYIPDEELNEDLRCISEDVKNTVSFLIGYAGIGKSTSLRHFFSFRNSVPVLLDDNETLIFPATFNGCIAEMSDDNLGCDDLFQQNELNNIKEELTRRINSICSFLEKNFSGLKERFDSKEGQRDFFEYLEETNPKVLEYIPYSVRMKIDLKEEYLKKLEYAYKEEGFICSVSKLKYYLGLEICNCKKIIVIVDDIEPLPYRQQVQLIMQYMKYYECMKNISLNKSEKKFVVNLVVSIRPHTYRILKEYRAFKAYFVTRVILKKNMVDLSEYFKRKIDLYKDDIPHNNKDAWKQAYTALEILSNKFYKRYSNMIKNLSLWNTRDAVEMYRRVLEDRIWIQRNVDKNAYFSIDEQSYVFNNITVLRAIACKNHCVFSREISDAIPNILYNNENTSNYSFLNLCIFSAFRPNRKIDYIYGSESIKFGELTCYLNTVFSNYENIEKDIDCAIKYLFTNKILRKSINDTDKIETIDTTDSLSKESLLYLSPRGYEIWQMIISDSVYMELCREDYYRDYEKKGCICESSFELLQSNNQIQIFLDLFAFLLELLDLEKDYLEYVVKNKAVENYRSYFGNEILTGRFYYGLMRSIKYSGNFYNTDIKKMEEYVRIKIEEVERLINM